MIVDDLFDVFYGTDLELNRLKKTKTGINFISRTSENNGVSTVVESLKDVKPFDAGLITVAVGSSSVLSSFVQSKPFYSGRDVMCLRPKKPMTLSEKLFYCMCIRANQYRYSFGRQANKTLKFLKLPEKIPDFVKTNKMPELSDVSKHVIEKKVKLTGRKWKYFGYDELFIIKKGHRLTNAQLKDGATPFIRAISSNNGIDRYIDVKPNHIENTITVTYDGSIAEAFYQPAKYFAIDSVNVLYPKFEMNVYIAMFLITLIRLEKYRYNYGRKWHKERMEKSIIKLPIDNIDNPDWRFMEDYIKSLPYSHSLQN